MQTSTTAWHKSSAAVVKSSRVSGVIRLFSSQYPEANPIRAAELLTCLNTNLDNHFIDEVALLLEQAFLAPAVHAKQRTRTNDGRPKYNDFQSWVQELPPLESDVTILANSDIYFDKSLIALAEALKPGQVAALSRWDVQPDGRAVLFERNDSQDAWVFKGPLRNVQADFPVGVPRCDNRFLYELKRAGYEVINPSYSVRAYHLHAGQRSEYKTEQLDHFVDPPYAYLWPHNLWSLPRTLWHNFRHPDVKVGWRLDRRKISSSLPFRAVRKVLRCFKLPLGSAT